VTATTLRAVGVKVVALEVPAAECVRRFNRDARRDALDGSSSRLVERRWRGYTGRDGDEMVQGVGGGKSLHSPFTGTGCQWFLCGREIENFFFPAFNGNSDIRKTAYIFVSLDII
jgi:hypothetical protein